MSETLRSRERLKQFFRTLMAGEASITPEVRERLIERLVKPINLMWVWEFPKAEANTTQPAKGDRASETPSENLSAEALAPALDEMAPWPEIDNSATGTPPNRQSDASPFNPFAFNAIVVFKREGAEALLAQLETIDTAENLKRLATAQHLAVPRGLDEPEALRLAIVKGAEQRLADRRAAGS